MTTYKVLLPVAALALLQLTSFFLYTGFALTLHTVTELLVVASYVSFIFSLLFFSVLDKSGVGAPPEVKEKLGQDKGSGYFILFVVALIFTFITLPTIKLTVMNVELGSSYVRNNIFREELRALVFGSVAKSALINLYVLPFLWWVAIVYSARQDRRSRLFFWFVLISLVAFNVSYAGRNAIYYMILVIYFSHIIRGKSVVGFIKRNTLLMLAMFFLGFLIVAGRITTREVTLLDNLFGLFEYHILQPFLFAQKIETIDWVDVYPFETMFKSLFFPVFYALGIDFGSTPLGMYASQFYEFTLYSDRSQRYYNSYTTFFPFFYSEFKGLSPVFIFVFVFSLLFGSLFVRSLALRKKLQAYIALMLFFSLFKFEIFTPGVLAIIFSVTIYGAFSRSAGDKGWRTSQDGLC